MKQFIHTLSVVFFLLLCVGCTQADIVLPEAGGKDDIEQGVPLFVKHLGLSLEIESRSVVTGGPGDGAINPNPLTTVGLCVTKQSSSGVVSAYASGNNTQVFTFDALAVPAVWQLAEGEEILLLFSEEGTVYGFSPAERNVSLSGIPREPLMSGVKVLDKQKFYFSDGGNPVDASTDIQWETDQDDYLYCTVPDKVDRWHPEVSLIMNHALAKVSFRVLEMDGESVFADASVKKVVLKSVDGFKKSSSAKLNLATGDLSGTMTVVDELWFTADGDMRTVGSNVVDVSDVAVQAFGLVIPITGVVATLEMTLDDDRMFTMTPPGGSGSVGSFVVNWIKGNNYIYNIRLSPQGVVIDNIEVADWGDGGSTEVPVE